jgi:hypothetical protein
MVLILPLLALPDLLMAQMGQHGLDIASAGSPRCDNNAKNWSYEPDGSLTVEEWRPGHGHRADSFGNRWPNIIVEKALTESETHVRARALEWLDTATDPNNGVQQVIAIKFGVDDNMTMSAWLYERGAAAEVPVQTIEFGDHGQGNGATEAGLDEMQLHNPVKSVYIPNAPPADLPGLLVLDLFYIRRTIREAFGIIG